METSENYSEKLNGIILMKEENLPVLPFIILDDNKDIKGQIESFLATIDQTKFCIRSDSPAIKIGMPAIVDATLDKDLEEILAMSQKYTTFVSHPGNIYRNLHSLNILKDGFEIIIEVVGSGFIAPDMDKHGLVHERFVFDLGFNKKSHEVVVGSDEYYQHKRKKIGAKRDLHVKNDSMLLTIKDYLPLTGAELRYVKTSLPKLEKVANRLGFGNFVASLSFIELNESIQPIFWDIFEVK